jgi:hypothetical protein
MLGLPAKTLASAPPNAASEVSGHSQPPRSIGETQFETPTLSKRALAGRVGSATLRCPRCRTLRRRTPWMREAARKGPRAPPRARAPARRLAPDARHSVPGWRFTLPDCTSPGCGRLPTPDYTRDAILAPLLTMTRNSCPSSHARHKLMLCLANSPGYLPQSRQDSNA